LDTLRLEVSTQPRTRYKNKRTSFFHFHWNCLLSGRVPSNEVPAFTCAVNSTNWTSREMNQRDTIMDGDKRGGWVRTPSYKPSNGEWCGAEDGEGGVHGQEPGKERASNSDGVMCKNLQEHMHKQRWHDAKCQSMCPASCTYSGSQP
jgi:hypothetical protein